MLPNHYTHLHTLTRDVYTSLRVCGLVRLGDRLYRARTPSTLRDRVREVQSGLDAICLWAAINRISEQGLEVSFAALRTIDAKLDALMDAIDDEIASGRPYRDELAQLETR